MLMSSCLKLPLYLSLTYLVSFEATATTTNTTRKNFHQNAFLLAKTTATLDKNRICVSSWISSQVELQTESIWNMLNKRYKITCVLLRPNVSLSCTWASWFDFWNTLALTTRYSNTYFTSNVSNYDFNIGRNGVYVRSNNLYKPKYIYRIVPAAPDERSTSKTYVKII